MCLPCQCWRRSRRSPFCVRWATVASTFPQSFYGKARRSPRPDRCSDVTWGVSHIPIRLRGLLYTNYFLVTWDWRHYVFATLLAILAVFIASYVPARRAAELPPVVTIRGSR